MTFQSLGSILELQNEQNFPRERALGGQAEQNLPSLSIQDGLGCQPSLCRLRWGPGQRRTRTAAAAGASHKTRKPRICGAMSRLHGLTVVLWMCPCCLANWLSVLASQKRSGRGSCSGSQCPQGPLSWPLRAGHNGRRVCALMSLCVCLCNCLHDCQSICLCDRETKMLAESSLWKINLGSFPCYVPGTLVLRNYDTAIVASLFCFLRDDLYPGVRNARLLKLSVCDLTSRK